MQNKDGNVEKIILNWEIIIQNQYDRKQDEQEKIFDQKCFVIIVLFKNKHKNNDNMKSKNSNVK